VWFKLAVRKRLAPKPLHDGKAMSLDEFRKWSPEDGFKYEWDNGILKAVSGMKSTERMIVARLLRRFSETNAYKSGDALLPEAETFFQALNKLRIPDLAYFTKDELLRSERGEEPIPKFIIEIISPTILWMNCKPNCKTTLQAAFKWCGKFFQSINLCVCMRRSKSLEFAPMKMSVLLRQSCPILRSKSRIFFNRNFS
jgi:hypothetical protein